MHDAKGHRITGLGLDGVQQTEAQHFEPHNALVQAIAEMGIAGLVAVVFVAYAIRTTLQRSWRVLAGVHSTALLVASSATIVVVLQALVTNVLTEGVIYWYWAALVAPAFALARQAGFEEKPN